MRKIRLRVLLKVGAICLILIFGILLLIQTPEIDKQTKILIIERSIRSPINREVCRHPYLPIDNPDIMKFYKAVGKIDCGNPLDDWVICEKSICFVKPEISSSHGDVICSYTDLIRKTDYKVKYGKTTKTKEPYVLQESDFVKVVCTSPVSGQSWFGMAYGIRDTVKRAIPKHLRAPPSIPILNDFNNPSLLNANGGDGGGNVVGGGIDGLPLDTDLPGTFFNVLIFGFDSLSRNAFIRKLPKTYKYLTQKLNSIVLKGYNIVGDGTPQALIPLLTGYTELELPETRKRMHNSENVDIYPMIWQDYERHGYITSFNEDVPNIGTFTYRMNGFAQQPVDHYLRTYYLEADNIWTPNKANCIGHQPDHLIMLDYTKNFMAKYSDSPRFIFSFHGGLSHDSINLIGAADDDVYHWLHEIKEKKLLDNTILVFMADHGNRFSEVRATLQGKQEERLPFFSFAFPETFRKRFPQQYANFEANADRLTTPFDVHATLKDILKLQLEELQSMQQFPPSPVQLPKNYDDRLSSLKDETDSNLFETSNTDVSEQQQQNLETLIQITNMASERAISLFEPIPANRSCADAYIEPHWCACLNWQTIPMNDTAYNGIILKMAGSILDAINNATQPFRQYCETLELFKINWVMRLRPHKEMLNYKRSRDIDGFLGEFENDNSNNNNNNNNVRLLHEEIYQLQIITQPGESLFEASVTHNLKTFIAHTKLTEISRINKYGAQANCIYDRNPELRKYCYCRV